MNEEQVEKIVTAVSETVGLEGGNCNDIAQVCIGLMEGSASYVENQFSDDEDDGVAEDVREMIAALRAVTLALKKVSDISKRTGGAL